MTKHSFLALLALSLACPVLAQDPLETDDSIIMVEDIGTADKAQATAVPVQEKDPLFNDDSIITEDDLAANPVPAPTTEVPLTPAPPSALDAPTELSATEAPITPGPDKAITPEDNLIETPATALEEKPAEEAPAPATAMPSEMPGQKDKAVLMNTSSDEYEDDDRPFNHRAGHWVMNFGFENAKYELPWAYQGSRRNFDEEKQDLWGGRMGFGREIYIPGGFLLGGRIDGYYLGTLFTEEEIAKPASSITLGAEKNTGQMFGGEAVGHFGWMFDFRTKNPFLGEMTYMAMELFAEAGVGRGQAYNRKNYYFRLNTDDKYDVIIEDNYTTASVSAGVNFLSTNTGFYLNLKATRIAQDIDKRKTRGISTVGGADTTINGSEKSPDTDPITVFTLGGGYKF